MSQPTEGPQPQRTWTETLDWLANQPQQNLENLGALAALQKNEFDRLIKQAQKVPLKDKINEKVSNVTARVHAIYDRESTRLSDMAQRLQSQAGQHLTAGREWAGQQVQAGREWGGQQVQAGREGLQAGREWAGQQAQAGREWAGQQVDRAAAFGGQQVDRAAAFRDRQVDRATEFGQQAVGAYQAGVEAAGRGIQTGREFAGQQVDRAAEFGGRQVDRATELGGRAMDAGRDLRDRAGRWLEAQKGRVTRAAEGARATVAMAKFDPTMQGVTTKDLTQLSQQHSRIMTGPSLDAKLEAAQNVVQQLQAQKDAQTAAQAFSGMAPAGQAVSQGQGAQTPTTSEQGAVNLQKNNENKGIGKG
ncbi:hypothetical protein OHB24_02885 [Kribbella sp. NBC_00482]|uniref:hypothetical protein n=1 Tax=Kribbella sp. NBC_00482 TaxID=2975968 RepID=UPI002E18265D